MTDIVDPFGWTGQVVAGKYRVDAVVAEGGFAVVYRAVHLGFDEKVALKCLKVPRRLQGADREKFLESFLAEGRLLHQLSKQTAGIVQALDTGAAQSPSGAWTPYLVLEWLDGITLDEDLAERTRNAMGGRSLAEAVALLDPVARALGIAHERGIAHRDVKPSNLFLATIAGRRTVKVVDFGIAKVISDVSSMTRALEETGASLQAFTPQYGAPEQFHKRFGATGPWTDVFALALVMVELMTGRPALDGDTTQLFVAVSDPTQRPTPRGFGVETSDAVDAVFARALAVEAKSRFRTATEFWDALLAATSRPASAFDATMLAPSSDAPSGVAPTVLAPSSTSSGLATRTAPPSTASPEIVDIVPAPTRSGRARSGPWIGLAIAGVVATGVAAVAFAWNRTPSASPRASSAPPSISPPIASSARPTHPAREPRVLPGATTSVFGAEESSASLGYLPELVAGRFKQDDGRSFLDAAHACLKRGLQLCSSSQWARACDVDPALGEIESWTATLSEDHDHVVVRGGQGCGYRRVSTGAAQGAKRAGVCCERGIPVRWAEGAAPLAPDASRAISAFEAAVDHQDARALAAMSADELRFFLLKNAPRERIEKLWVEQFAKYPDLWIQHESCELAAPVDGTWTANCSKLCQQAGDVGLVTSRYVWDIASGKVTGIFDPRVTRTFGPI